MHLRLFAVWLGWLVLTNLLFTKAFFSKDKKWCKNVQWIQHPPLISNGTRNGIGFSYLHFPIGLGRACTLARSKCWMGKWMSICQTVIPVSKTDSMFVWIQNKPREHLHFLQIARVMRSFLRGRWRSEAPNWLLPLSHFLSCFFGDNIQAKIAWSLSRSSDSVELLVCWTEIVQPCA